MLLDYLMIAFYFISCLLKNEIDNMKEALNEMNLLDIELKQKDDSIKHLKAQSKKIKFIQSNHLYIILFTKFKLAPKTP
jgi:hypothetical protein